MRTPTPPAKDDLNLVPLMNLVVCLIPMVLLGASFVEVGSVNVQSPRFSCVGVCDAPPQSQVTVAIGEAGFIVDIDGARSEIPGRDGHYDWVALYNRMVEIKRSHPDQTLVQLTADPQMRYAKVIRTMDTLRNRLEHDTYSDLTAFRSARVRVEDRLLWPDVVLAIGH